MQAPGSILIYEDVYVFVQIYIYIYIRISVFIYICIYICIYLYIWTVYLVQLFMVDSLRVYRVVGHLVGIVLM